MSFKVFGHFCVLIEALCGGSNFKNSNDMKRFSSTFQDKILELTIPEGVHIIY